MKGRFVVSNCTVPGCGARMHPQYASYAMRVCKAHRHAPGYCRCPTCTGAAPLEVQAKRSRDHIRVAVVPYATGCSSMTGQAAVSLRKEPWAT